MIDLAISSHEITYQCEGPANKCLVRFVNSECRNTKILNMTYSQGHVAQLGHAFRAQQWSPQQSEPSRCKCCDSSSSINFKLPKKTRKHGFNVFEEFSVK